MNKNKIVHNAIIAIFVSLYALVATISMINSVAFFDLAHNGVMSWILAIGFELGAAASLAALIILDRTNKNMVWGLFILLTAFQMMANSFHAYINLEEYRGWIELFGLERQPEIAQKRILSAISGAVLPIVSLGFIKSLVDYIRPDVDEAANSTLTKPKTKPKGGLNDRPDVQRALQYAADQAKKRRDAGEPIEDEPTALANSKYRLEDAGELDEDPDEDWDDEHATDMVLNDMIEDLGDEFAEELKHSQETNEETVEKVPTEAEQDKAPQPAKSAVQKPVQPVQPSRSGIKKVIPVNSGNAIGMAIRKNAKGSPVAGSPSR